MFPFVTLLKELQGGIAFPPFFRLALESSLFIPMDLATIPRGIVLKSRFRQSSTRNCARISCTTTNIPLSSAFLLGDFF
jgi:hypothetical protein